MDCIQYFIWKLLFAKDSFNFSKLVLHIFHTQNFNFTSRFVVRKFKLQRQLNYYLEKITIQSKHLRRFRFFVTPHYRQKRDRRSGRRDCSTHRRILRDQLVKLYMRSDSIIASLSISTAAW
jgi:hypothetical protein